MDVALGFRPHSGWAAAVAVTGRPAEAVVVDRHRLPLSDLPPPVQPYHEAAGLDPDTAAALVEQATQAAYRWAAAEVSGLVDGVRSDGHEIAGVGIAAGPGSIRDELPLTRILAAHGTLHAAEGELYRDALADAAAALGLAVALVPPRDAAAAGRRLFRCGDAELRTRLTDLGKPLGPPWTRDQKDAVIAALLAAGSGAGARPAAAASAPGPSKLPGR
jgi:hypothetical protein